MNEMLIGAIAMSCLLIGMFFLRFWKNTRDRFFIFFALAFWIEGISRLCIFAVPGARSHPICYGLRLLAYLLIAAAIIDKNRRTATRTTVSE